MQWTVFNEFHQHYFMCWLFVLLQIKKRGRKTADFWDMIGGLVGQEGDATQKLIKNLGSDFQRITLMQHVSGCATEQPQLRGSVQLYELYDEYYQLYYPQGGSVMPKIVLTESSLTQ